MRTPTESELVRAATAREEWIKWRMQDVPSIYCALMPVTSNGEQLMMAEKRLREMVSVDLKFLTAHPWRAVGPEPSTVDFSTLPEHVVTDLCIVSEPEAGFPGVVRDGFEDHPEVLHVLRNLREPNTPATKFLNLQYELDKANDAIEAMTGDDFENFDRDRHERLISRRKELQAELEKARAAWPEAPTKPPEPWKIGDVERLERESGK